MGKLKKILTRCRYVDPLEPSGQACYSGSVLHLNTERLSFRRWTPEDIELARLLWGDPDVMRFIGARQLNNNEIALKLEAEMICQEKNGISYWPFFEKITGDFVGCCGLKPWVHSSRKGPEVGFHLAKAKWGKGYAKEAARRVLEFAFDEIGSERVLAGHHPENSGSRKILLALGFQFLEDVLFKPTGLLHPSYELGRTEYLAFNRH